MLKKELVVEIMKMAEGEYTKTRLNRMRKADLEKLHEELSAKMAKAEEEKCTKDDVQVDTAAEQETVAETKEFDVEKYINFVCHKKLRDRKPSTHQYNLIKTLEINYKVRFDNVDSATFGELSDRIRKCLIAIKEGRVEKRSEKERLDRIKNYKPKVDNSATKAQLRKITELEKITGVTCKRVVSSKQVASEIINEYLEILKAKEVAVTTSDVSTNIQDKLNDKTFRRKFAERLKRVFI
jgi:hypothetical protein